MSKELKVDVDGIERTGHCRDGVDVLEVSLRVEWVSGGTRTFSGWIFPDKVEFKSDPDEWDLDRDELKELMAQVAANWDEQFGDWESEVASHSEIFDS